MSKLIDDFGGKGDVGEWILKFETLATVYDWPVATKSARIVSCMCGIALTFVST